MSILSRPPEPVAIDHILPRVLKPSRYVANERNVIRKRWTDDMVAVALCFPEVYEIGMSNNGMKILYHIVNRRTDAVAERAYSPWPDMESLMRRSGVRMFSHESRASLADFDVVGFSLAYELTYTNVLTMLDLAGIPLLARDRTSEHPIVLGGGTTMANPEPVADFFDAFAIGDGEDVIGDVIDVVKRHRRGGYSSRTALLHDLANVEGIYVPRFYDVVHRADGVIEEIRPNTPGVPFPVKRRIVNALRLEDFPEKPLVPVTEITQDRLALEVLRGCTQGCRFCQAGYFYRPIRERSPEDILTLASNGVDSGGWDELSLISLSTADHSRIEETVARINRAFEGRNVGISLPSLRADAFSVSLAEGIGEVKRSGFTFAPETGSERLRAVINKNITNEQLVAAARAAYEKGWRLIKLYFMIGLPTETMEDVQSIVALSESVANAGRVIRRDVQVNASIGCFSPKSFTPFQWVPFAGLEVLRERMEFLKRNMRDRAVNLKWHSPEDILLEAVISRGDRRLGAAILEAWRQGARFDGWHEHSDLGRWHRAIAAVGLDLEFYLRERGLDEVLPWDLIDIGVSKRYLRLEWKRALAGEWTADCRWDQCNACGIPGMPDDNKLTRGFPVVQMPVEIRAEERRMNEESRRTEAESGSPEPMNTPPVDPAPDDRASMPGQEGFGGGMYRLRYSVGDQFKFVGHVDLMQVFHRSFTIARLPLAMSQGNTPRPKAAFGPPLPVGCTSDAEYVDIELSTGVYDLAERLNATLPEGLQVMSALRIAERTESLSSAIESAIYDLAFPARALTLDAIAECLDRFAATPAWPVTRIHKDKSKVIDLRRAIPAWTILPESGEERTVVRMMLKMNDAGGQNANPGLVLSGLFALDEEGAAWVACRRIDLLDRNGTPIGDRAWHGRRSRQMHAKSMEFLRWVEA